MLSGIETKTVFTSLLVVLQKIWFANIVKNAERTNNPSEQQEVISDQLTL